MRLLLFTCSILCLALVCVSPATAQRVSALQVALQGRAQGLEQQALPKGFTLKQMQVSGQVQSAEAESVELSLKFTAEVFSPGVQEIPLRLSTCILSAAPKYSSPDIGQALSFDSTRGGFLWIIEDASASLESIQTHVLEIKVVAPITVTAERNEIALRLPMAFESELTLQVPQTEADAKAPRGEDPEIEHSAAGSKIRLAHLDRDFSLRWWKTSQEDLSERVVIDEHLFTWLDPIRQLIRHDFQFTVEGDIQQGDTLRVHVPEGYEIVSASPPLGNIVQGESRSASRGGELGERSTRNNQRRGITVELEVTPDETIRLVCERSESDFDDLRLDRPALELASRPVGVWSIAAPQGWLLSPRALPDVVEQIDVEEFSRSTSAELPEAGELGLAMRYWGDPSPLRLQLFRPRKVVTVQPTHSVFAASNVLQLNSTFDINIASGEAHGFDFDLHDWVFEEARLEEGNLALEGEVDDFGILHLPLQRPLNGRLRLVIVASLDIRAYDEVQFELPVLGEAAIRNGTFEMVAAENWEFVPQPLQFQGLTVVDQEFSDNSTYQLTGPRSRIVGLMRPLPNFQMSSNASLDISPDLAVIRQQLSTFAAAGELRGLQLQVPRWLWEQGKEHQLEFQLNGEPGALVMSADSQQPATQEDLVTLEMPPELFRDLESASDSAAQRQVLLLSYALTLEDSISPPTTQAIALAVPANAAFAGHDVSVASGLACSLRLPAESDSWRVESNASAEGTSRYRTSALETELRFECVASSRAAPGHSVISELVIQSWLGYEFREDRVMFVWQPDSAESELTVQLPAFAIAQCVLRHSNGTARWLEKDDDGNVTVIASDLMPEEAQAGGPIPLELIYRIPGDHTGSVQLPPPRFGEDVRVVHTYWHLALPADEHLIWSGQEMQNDNAWNWSSGWKRAPGLTLGSLESRVEAVSAPALPITVNQYLFSGIGLPESLSLVTSNRSLIVGSSSLVVLLLGILYLGYPAVRRPSIALGTLIALVALTFLFQSVALMFVQASVLGISLLFAAALLRRLVKREVASRPGKGRDDSRHSNSGIRDHGSTPRTEIRSQGTPTTSS